MNHYVMLGYVICVWFCDPGSVASSLMWAASRGRRIRMTGLTINIEKQHHDILYVCMYAKNSKHDLQF